MQPPQRTAALDLAIVLGAIVVAWQFSKWVLYPALSIADNAPYILRPITGFFVAWWILHRRGESWRDLGLRKPSSWWRVAAVAIALYAPTTPSRGGPCPRSRSFCIPRRPAPSWDTSAATRPRSFCGS